MSKMIIGIHGLSNKSPKDTLEKWWKQAIQEGLQKNVRCKQDFEFSLVYWADLYYKYPLHQDKDYEFDSLYNKEPYVKSDNKALTSYKEGWLSRMRAELTNPDSEILQTLKSKFDIEAATNYLLSAFFKDLHFYYSGKKLRDRNGKKRPIQQILTQQLKNEITQHKGKDLMLIAHSMGTIIAFDTLHKLPKSTKVSQFITMGSPLGIPQVKVKAAESGSPLAKPMSVTGNWVNFADKKDAIALDPHLADDYGGGIIDEMVLNDYHINGKHNYHKSYGYLRTPEISKYIAEFLRGESNK
ncbi:lipase/acyltransferase domain-containing protein [Candidatus Uabimicrobium amorphum]|uniref:Serine peptidase n=1 Tax=Uabimicrobium amorphum TaxID=2596890 RepID=A0A5S9F5E7_UABAM|nr:hypothetical protein [Candidatus Uabimicrobium amorphum]BBM86528.1 serine peptidase [Candidatus Uabimicrobium amorphum]